MLGKCLPGGMAKGGEGVVFVEMKLKVSAGRRSTFNLIAIAMSTLQSILCRLDCDERVWGPFASF